MSYHRIIHSLSMVLMIIGLSMLIPFLCSLYYGETEAYAFFISSGLVFLVSFIGYKTTKMEGVLLHKEVYCIVALSWLLAAFFGAVPYLLAGTFTSLADAFFETMSGFTTTGASVLSNVEVLPKGILFWRSLTHWLGGMGIIVLFVALISAPGVGGVQMFQAESPGGTLTTKLKPRISESAKTLWFTYVVLTIMETILLCLFGMPLFDALCHTFGSVATGGFSTKNASIGYYQSAGIEWIITIFMFLSGANFALHYQAMREKSLRPWLENGEFKLYALLVVGATAFVSLNLYQGESTVFGETIRQAAFQVVSIITTTGYASVDFDQWSFFAKAVLLILMFIGGCVGSTSGSIKVGRLLVLLKQTILDLQRHLHPHAVISLKLDGEVVEQEKIMRILQFFFIYIALILFGVFFMSFLGLGLVEAVTSVATTLGNVGPGFGQLGPMQNFGFISAAGKYFLSFYMLLGRLELFTLLVLFLPSFWRKE